MTRSRAALTATSSADIANAAVKSSLKLAKMASGSVCETPARLPANMIVAPNSPSARAQAITAPPSRAGNASGTVTDQNVCNRETPSVA